MTITHTIMPNRDTRAQIHLLQTFARDGVRQRFGFTRSIPQTETENDISRRLDQEIQSVIMSRKVNQFLMMRDIVSFAKKHDIPVSPGYGLAPGSLLAYALYITQVDPYRYDLIYEDSPFLGSTLGINISAKSCTEVIRYVKKQYTAYDDSYPVELSLVEMPVLDVVHDMLDQIRQSSGAAIDLDNIPLDDKATYELLQRGDTHGVYQLESKATRRYLQEWAPTILSDIFAITALYRYGSEHVVPMVIANKYKESRVSFHHPQLESVTMETYGIIIYHDQVIRAAKLLASYTSDQGDALRRDLYRRQADKAAAERLRFVDACGRVNGIAPYLANLLFDVLEKCSVYTVSKPHVVAHGLLTYQMAYLKTHFRAEFEKVRQQMTWSLRS
jgi:DNA polymerase III alpha subunit